MDRMQRLHASAAATHQERLRLREDQARIKDIVDRLPQLEAQYADLTRSYDATKALHTRIFDQLKTTELQFELERASATARYEIISAPQLAYSSMSKTVAKRSMLAGLMGLVCGIVLATILQVRKLLAAFASIA